MSRMKTPPKAPGRLTDKLPGVRPFPKFPPDPIPFKKPRPLVELVKLDNSLRLKEAQAAAKIGAGAIVNEIIWEIENAIAGAGKTVSNSAFNEFRPALLGGVGTKLLNGGDWSVDGPPVRGAGTQMGFIAAALAHPSTEVAKAHVHQAFYAVKNGSTVCSTSGGVVTTGAGSWCDFFI